MNNDSHNDCMTDSATLLHCCYTGVCCCKLNSTAAATQSVSQGQTVAADKLPTLTLTVTVSSRDNTAELVAYYVLWTESLIHLL